MPSNRPAAPWRLVLVAAGATLGAVVIAAGRPHARSAGEAFLGDFTAASSSAHAPAGPFDASPAPAPRTPPPGTLDASLAPAPRAASADPSESVDRALASCNVPLVREPVSPPSDGADLLYYVNRARTIPPDYPIPAGWVWSPCLGGSLGPSVDLVCLPVEYSYGKNSLRRVAYDSPAPPGKAATFDGREVGFKGKVGFKAMLDAARAEAGFLVYVRSGFRSYTLQGATFRGWETEEEKRGLTRDEALRKTSTYSARAGHSEHQLGTTADLLFRDPVTHRIYEGWDDTAIGDAAPIKWVDENAHRFGIVLTYGRDKVDVTGYRWEPWHYRYVGVEAADAMRACGLDTEEFLRIRYRGAEGVPALGAPASPTPSLAPPPGAATTGPAPSPAAAAPGRPLAPEPPGG